MADSVAMIVVSAGVAAIVLSAALACNGWRERLNRVSLQQMKESHEATLHDLDRRHEAHLQDLDRRHEIALRDVGRRQEVAMLDLDRKHETRFHELADMRALRDLKVGRPPPTARPAPPRAARRVAARPRIEHRHAVRGPG